MLLHLQVLKCLPEEFSKQSEVGLYQIRFYHFVAKLALLQFTAFWNRFCYHFSFMYEKWHSPNLNESLQDWIIWMNNWTWIKVEDMDEDLWKEIVFNFCLNKKKLNWLLHLEKFASWFFYPYLPDFSTLLKSFAQYLQTGKCSTWALQLQLGELDDKFYTFQQRWLL